MRTRISLLSCLALLAATAVSSAFKWDLPDPRYRGPVELWELEAVAFMVASASGLPIAGYIEVAKDEDAPLIKMRGPLTNNVLVLNPLAVRGIPPNSWAFIFGHEFALRTRTKSEDPSAMSQAELERRADRVGATFARAAGFDLGAHLAWALGPRRELTDAEQATAAAVMAMAKDFRIPRWRIEMHGRRMAWGRQFQP
jgi:hypothetical protein